MKHTYRIIIYSILLTCTMGIIGYIILNRTTNKICEELSTLKKLYEVQEEILNDNFSEKELDSLYLEYNYYYLHKYYQMNHK